MKQFKSCFLILSLVFLFGCKTDVANNSKNEESLSNQDESIELVPESKTVTIRSIGDVLIHDYVYNAADMGSHYDFTTMFEEVKPYIENADITTANLETIAAGNRLGVSTYPNFNAPEEIIDSLKDCGVDIVNNLTNHTLDFGAEGAYASIEALKERDMMYVGSYESQEDYNTPRIIEANGIKVGFLSYCYGANGYTVSEEDSHLFTWIDKDLIKKEVEDLNKVCDVSVVFIHNGEEYEFVPNENQLYIQQAARDGGANFILGGHPHHVQPLVYYNESQAGMFSHGNFLSGQYERYTKIGCIVEYNFEKTGEDVRISGMRIMPTYNCGLPEVDYYKVVPLVDASDYVLSQDDVDFLYQEFSERMTYFTDKVEVVPYLD